MHYAHYAVDKDFEVDEMDAEVIRRHHCSLLPFPSCEISRVAFYVAFAVRACVGGRSARMVCVVRCLRVT